MIELHGIEFDTARLHQLRSEFLDSFSLLETAACALLRREGSKISAAPFSARCTELANLKPSPSLSKQAVANIAGLVQEISAISKMRGDIVHSILRVRTMDGTAVAQFINAAHAHDDHPYCRILAATDFDALSRKTKTLAAKVSALAVKSSPASSPPPPSPGAATDP